MSNRTGFAFQNFILMTPGAATTETAEFVNARSFEIIAFRASLSTGTGTLNFYETVDGTNRFSRSIYHVEANAFVSTVATFSAGNFVAACAGMADVQFEKVTAAASTVLTVVGRGAFGSGIDGAILGPAGPDDKQYIDCLDGTGTIVVYKRNHTTTDVFDGTFTGIADVSNGATILVDTATNLSLNYQFRNPAEDIYHYVSPESRPVLRSRITGGPGFVTGTTGSSGVDFGFRVALDTIDFADVIGFGISIYGASNYDYTSNAGLLNPGTGNRNYSRLRITIRDSTQVAIWQVNKLDIPWNGGTIGDITEDRLDTADNHTDTAPDAGSASALGIDDGPRYEPVTVRTWATAGDTPGQRDHVGDINLYRNGHTGFFDLEFSLERNKAVDTIAGFYQSPTGYDIDGNPYTLGSPSGSPTWDFSDAAFMDVYCSLSHTTTLGNFVSDNISDVTQSGAGGQGFPNPLGVVGEIQYLYYKDLFLRKRPFEYASCINFSVEGP